MDEQIDPQQYKQRLIKLRDELLQTESIAKEGADTVELDQSRVGRLSRMDALQSQAMAQAMQDRTINELRKIAAALVRIETGDYGYCLDCGEQIEKGRLDFDPAAAYCLACASNREKN